MLGQHKIYLILPVVSHETKINLHIFALMSSLLNLMQILFYNFRSNLSDQTKCIKKYV